MNAPCPRAGCTNPVAPGRSILCVGDFQLLAGMCRGKKPLGAPTAAALQDSGRGRAYACLLCRMHHNGDPATDRAATEQVAAAAVQALREHPLVGPAGALRLIDAWDPRWAPRAQWPHNLTQSVLFATPDAPLRIPRTAPAKETI